MASDFHGRIMNIQLDPGYQGNHVPHMKLGHKQARHTAAEIANEADIRIAELEAELREAASKLDAISEAEEGTSTKQVIARWASKARAALGDDHD
jgi:hypothetical protein